MIQSGSVELGSQSGWTLNTGTGARSFTSPDIPFPAPFSQPPKVVLALSGLDCEHSANTRVTLYPADVEADEFNIVVNTWEDSLIYSVVVTWIAHDG